VKGLNEIIGFRKKNKEERDEHELLVDLYLRAMESTEMKHAKAA
jgi:uncharacterized protein (UPF0335 family)